MRQLKKWDSAGTSPYKLVVRFCSAAILKTGTHASTGLLETHCQCLVLRLYTTVATNRMSTLLIPLGRVPICITTKALLIYNLVQPRRPSLRIGERVHTYDFSQCAPKSGLVTQIHDEAHELTATMVHHVPQAGLHPKWIFAVTRYSTLSSHRNHLSAKSNVVKVI